MPFPANKVVTFKYVTYYNIEPNLLNPVNYAVFRANSIYAPEQAFGGHRPMGVDQWGAFYQQYCVIGAKITVKPVQYITEEEPVSQSPPGVYGIILSRDTNPPSSTVIQAAMEQGLGVWRYSTISGVSAGSALSLGYSAKKFWNITNVNDNRDYIGSGFGSDPPALAYWTLYYGGVPTSNYPAPLTFVVTIRYKCTLAVPQILPLNA